MKIGKEKKREREDRPREREDRERERNKKEENYGIGLCKDPVRYPGCKQLENDEDIELVTSFWVSIL